MSLDLPTLVRHLGLILLGGLFVWGGVFHFRVFAPVKAMLAARRWPLPGLQLAVASGFEIIAGLTLMSGAFTVWAAAGLAAFTLVASVTLLDFWRQAGEARQAAFNGFLTNMAVLGGLLVLAAGG